MSEELTRHRQLQESLWTARWKRAGEESSEEDQILEEMDKVWRRLPADEQVLLQSDGPKCWRMGDRGKRVP
jgi:hypothetical protein